ncbi:MAG: EamA family transporter [Pseudomonadota bacterium]
MLWFTLALGSAFTGASSDALTKRCFGHLNSYEKGLVRLLFALPFLAALAVVVPWPPTPFRFWVILALMYPLEALALLLYMRAISVSALSLTLPFLAFTPAFLVGTGCLFLGEMPNGPGAAGIVLIIGGSYVLNLDLSKKSGWTEPFKAVWQEEGSALMLLVAFIYSITSALGKVAIQMTTPAFFGAAYPALLALALAVVYPLTGKARLRNLGLRPWMGLLLGVIYAGMFVSHALAISRVQAAYMVAVKRTSLIFGVAYGGVIFKEEHMTQRLAGAAFMVAGVAVIAIWG